MGILGKIFTWWDGATIGTSLYSARYGTKVGEDHLGNIYYTGKDDRRWVIYNGSNDASRVPSEWHGWLHHTFDDVPESFLPPPRIWERNRRLTSLVQPWLIGRKARWNRVANARPQPATMRLGAPTRHEGQTGGTVPACPAPHGMRQ